MVKNKHILCLRFSALGDVAMASSVVRASAVANPQVKYTFAAPARLRPLIAGCNVIPVLPNLEFLPVDKKDGVFTIYRQLKKVQPTHLADLHNVQRTWVLRTLFWLRGIRVTYVKKNRRGRLLLVRQHNKKWLALPSMCDEFARTLVRLELVPASPQKLVQETAVPSLIGIAPFAKHQGKQWLLERMEELIQSLVEQGYTIRLFGGGEREISKMQKWTQKYPHVEAVCGLPFEQELEKMAQTQAMITMDSANMHFASLLGVKVISVWGATHPFTGFYGYGQKPEWAVQAALPCRPCSVYGAATCYKGTYECLYQVTVSQVLDLVNTICK